MYVCMYVCMCACTILLIKNMTKLMCQIFSIPKTKKKKKSYALAGKKNKEILIIMLIKLTWGQFICVSMELVYLAGNLNYDFRKFLLFKPCYNLKL